MLPGLSFLSDGFELFDDPDMLLVCNKMFITWKEQLISTK